MQNGLIYVLNIIELISINVDPYNRKKLKSCFYIQGYYHQLNGMKLKYFIVESDFVILSFLMENRKMKIVKRV